MISQDLSLLNFRLTDTPSARAQKLEVLKDTVIINGQHRLYISITDGLPTADPTSPLFRYRPATHWVFGTAVADAGIAATGTTTLRVFRAGVSNGTISFTGTTGTDAITNHDYPAGTLLEIYPPVVANATLDDVSISIPLTVV